MFRLYTISAIIGLALAGSVFVFQNSPLLKEKNRVAQDQSGNLNNLVTGKPFVESLTAKNSNNQANLGDNLTENFTKGIGRIIYENNPSGPQDFYGEKVLNTPDPEKIAESLLAEAANKFDPSFLRPIVKDDELVISENSSKEALINYFYDANKIMVSEAEEIIPDLDMSKELTIEEIALIATAHQKAINKLYKLAIPKLVVKIHKQEIELLSATKNIFEKILNYQNDPFTAILAATELEKIDIQFKNLGDEKLKFIRSNNLPITIK
jgi:hypothetical protein